MRISKVKSRVASSLVLLLAISLIPSGLPLDAPGKEWAAPTAEKLDGDGGEVGGVGQTGGSRVFRSLPKKDWPGAGSSEVDLRAGTSARAGNLPISIQGISGSPERVKVEVLGREALSAAYRDSLAVRLTPVSGNSGPAKVSVDYSAFKDAVGGDWSSRLRLWQVPECALSTPDKPECRSLQLLTKNDTRIGTVTATASVAPGSFVVMSGGGSGSGGDFTATTLQPSSTWSSGGSSGDFSWNYPLRIIPTPGPQPSISLAYSSSSVDGRSEATNNQPSWTGEGFEYSPGYIERRYVPCAEDMENGANNTEKTGDMCWRSDNATMSLNGRGGELIFETGKGWHSRSEDGSKIEKIASAGNGDDDSEAWKVTTTDGTQYFFGLHSLPGQSSATESVNTMPVFGNHVGEPCRQTTFASSSCTQAYRWNLDYIVDVRGNTMSYWYEKEFNKYARNNTATDDATYVRASVLKRIDYGTYKRTAAEHGIDESSVAAVAQVLFATGDRCFINCWNGSEPVAGSWQDTPLDQRCVDPATECPQQFSPTFWSMKRLSTITTRVWDTTKTPAPDWQNVESWTLTHSFPGTGSGTNAGIWLDSIVHAGLVGTASTLPPITFQPISMPNRVLTQQTGTNNWHRMSNIITETGSMIHIDYSLPECTSGNLPSEPHTNTMRCYPVMVVDPNDPQGEALIPQWWHKYVVTHVSEEDVQLAGAVEADAKHTYYEYVGTPAWHYADDDGLSKPEHKTWSQFRGYATVKTRTGEDPATQTLQVANFMRGMHGDRDTPTGGTKTVIVPASVGTETVYDYDQFAGMVREQATFNGVETKPVSKSVNVPWRSNPTASRTINGNLVESRFTETETAYTSQALGVDGSRGWRTSRTSQDFDHTYGTSNWSQDHGDINVAGDEKCTTYYYTRNTAKNLVATVKQVTAIALPCGTNPSSVDDVLSDVRNFYDGATSIDTTPVYGSMSRVDLLKDWSLPGGTVWQTVNQNTFDKTGRALTTTDLKGNVTTTAYTPTVGGPVTKVTTTGPAPYNWVSIVDIKPYWGSAWKATDQNNKTTGEATYDALGRTFQVWHQGWVKAGHESQPSAEYTYQFPSNRDTYTYIKTRTLNAKGSYNTSYEILDGHLRHRQTQGEAADGSGNRVVADTIYDAFGRPATTYAAHAEPGAPSGSLWSEPEWSVPSVGRTEFDRASRATAEVFLSGDGITNLVEKWRTVTFHEGDLTKITPPEGGVAATVLTDIQGRTTHMRQHNTPAGIGGAYDETRYEFNRKDQVSKVIDSAGNEWTYKYDAKGRETETVDPDSGKIVTEYNDANEAVKTTDDRNVVLVTKYDQIGRRTQLREGSDTGPLRSEWKYDTLYTGVSTNAKGHLTQAIRYEPAGSTNAYKWQARNFNDRYQPGGANIVIPAVEAGLNLTYVYGFGYSTFNGAPTTLTYPAAGDLPIEQVTTDYDSTTGMPVRLDTNWGLAAGTMAATWYTAFGEVDQLQRKMPGGLYVDELSEYDNDTRRLSSVKIKKENAVGTLSDRNYEYDLAGNVTEINDTPEVGSVDRQCFGYDYLARLKSAWTPAAGINCETTSPSVAGLSGPAPYWLEWDIDKSGNRLSEISRYTGGQVTRTYAQPVGGAGVVRPHAVTSMTTAVQGQSPVTVNYQYDSSGNTTCRPNMTVANDCATGTNGQKLDWTPEGMLDKVTSGGQALETNVYDADNQRIIRRDSTGTTLYLPGQEIRREGSVNTGTRYYSFAGTVIGSRSGGGLHWTFSDHQGTQQIAIKADTHDVSIRRQTPYGEDRGTNPVWVSGKGFVGGDNDPTGLVNVGARNYDRKLGRFVSDDPVTDAGDSQQIHGYAYANNTPITASDPSGLKLIMEGDGPTCGTQEQCVAIAAQSELDNANAEIEKAKKLKEKSFTDILLEEGLNLLLDMLGVTDIIDCFTKGDLMACGSMIMSALPVGRIFKVAKSIWKAIDRGMSAFKAWRKTVAVAEAVLKKADDVLAAAKSKLDDALARVDDAPTAGLDEVAEAGESCLVNSFAPETQVLLANGNTKEIENVSPGDVVLATDPQTGETAGKEVEAHITGEGIKQLVDVTVATADGKETIVATARHPFWIESESAWLDAIDLKPGMTVLTPSGEALRVVAVRGYEEWSRVNNLTVEDIHTYYVMAGESPVLVHNCRGKLAGHPKNCKCNKKPRFEVDGNGVATDRHAPDAPAANRRQYVNDLLGRNQDIAETAAEAGVDVSDAFGLDMPDAVTADGLGSLAAIGSAIYLGIKHKFGKGKRR